jgi:hypothetical protein
MRGGSCDEPRVLLALLPDYLFLKTTYLEVDLTIIYST